MNTTTADDEGPKGILITDDVIKALGGEIEPPGGYVFKIAGAEVRLWQYEDKTTWQVRINGFRQHSVTHLDEVIGYAWLDGCEYGKILKQQEVKSVLGIPQLGMGL